jgi:hypothetical protein
MHTHTHSHAHACAQNGRNFMQVSRRSTPLVRSARGGELPSGIIHAMHASRTAASASGDVMFRYSASCSRSAVSRQDATCNMQRAPCKVPRAAHHRQRRSTASRRTQAVKPCCTNAALPPACPCVPATARIVLEHARTGPSCVRHGARCTLRCASHDTWRYRSVVDDGPATTRSPCASASRLKLPPVAADGIRVRRARRSQGPRFMCPM